jgi:hypothetical protein
MLGTAQTLDLIEAGVFVVDLVEEPLHETGTSCRGCFP